MLLSKRLLKPIAGLLIPFFVLTSVPSSVSFADIASKNVRDISYEKDAAQNVKRVVVSMGDSYSAGEGISPFYGNRYSESEPLYDFLAHRSQLAWSSLLYLDKDNPGDKLRNHKASCNPLYNKKDNTAWYFVAASGAVTENIDGKQEKKYSDILEGKGVTTAYLDPQIKVLNDIKNEETVVPEYITMTLGGNDVGFVDVLGYVGTHLGYLDPNDLEKQLDHSMKKLTRGDGGPSVREKLRETYCHISNTSQIGSKKPCIIVAGYPRLLNDNESSLLASFGIDIDVIGKIKKTQFLFDIVEAKKVNACIDYFDETIKELVEQCRKKYKLNIEFVDVRDEFKGHEVYTDDPWINGAELLSKADDLLPFPLKRKEGENAGFEPNPSAYSIHPNGRGSNLGYRKCVQDKIDELEAKKKNPNATPTPTPIPTIKPTLVTPSIGETKTSQSESEPEYTIDPATGRKVIKFGKWTDHAIEWLVLDENEDEMLVLSKYILKERQYHNTRMDINWGTSELRKWLQRVYTDQFSNEERERIKLTNVKTEPNPISGAGETVETEDYIFLLSLEEAEKYFARAQRYGIKATNYEQTKDYSWWLRTTGYYANQATYAESDGYFNSLGEYVDVGEYGVRPAMWIAKEAVKDEPTETEPTESAKVDSRGIAVLDSPNSTVIKVDGEPHDFKIPMIRIPDVPVSLTNKAIEREVNKFNINKSKLYLNSPYDSHYRYYISEKTITIIVEFWRINGGEDERDELIFNIEIKTGELLNGSQVVKLYGMTDKQFFSKVKTCYKNFYTLERNYKGDKPAKKAYDANLKRVSYKYIVPFMDNDGRLFFAGKVNYIAAGGYGYLYFSIDKENINYYWGPSE